jgi:phosphohistidine phosphatase|tara:strand:- start:2727 stop:3215 length:489 start_codon:yes stop_codon:yes gene_type:complete
MKTITFIRHAKSSWEFELSDKKRPLNKRGLFDVEFMASLGVVKTLEPDAVFCSTALRTRETCHVFLKKHVYQASIVSYLELLYCFNPSDLNAFIDSINPRLTHVIIIGHNPALTAVINQLGDLYIENLPTCGIVKINFKTASWQGLPKGQIEYRLFPKQLMP